MGEWENALHIQGAQTITVADFGSFPILEVAGKLSLPDGWRLVGRGFVSKARTVGSGRRLGADLAVSEVLSVTTRAGFSVVGVDVAEGAASFLAGPGYRIR